MKKDIANSRMLVNMFVIHITSAIRKKIGIPEGTKFKIWREGSKIKLESV